MSARKDEAKDEKWMLEEREVGERGGERADGRETDRKKR